MEFETLNLAKPLGPSVETGHRHHDTHHSCIKRALIRTLGLIQSLSWVSCPTFSSGFVVKISSNWSCEEWRRLWLSQLGECL
nr:hypothetical protein CFP56_40357 [Quercus suber]